MHVSFSSSSSFPFQSITFHSDIFRGALSSVESIVIVAINVHIFVYTCVSFAVADEKRNEANEYDDVPMLVHIYRYIIYSLGESEPPWHVGMVGMHHADPSYFSSWILHNAHEMPRFALTNRDNDVFFFFFVSSQHRRRRAMTVRMQATSAIPFCWSGYSSKINSHRVIDVVATQESRTQIGCIVVFAPVCVCVCVCVARRSPMRIIELSHMPCLIYIDIACRGASRHTHTCGYLDSRKNSYANFSVQRFFRTTILSFVPKSHVFSSSSSQFRFRSMECAAFVVSCIAIEIEKHLDVNHEPSAFHAYTQFQLLQIFRFILFSIHSFISFHSFKPIELF